MLQDFLIEATRSGTIWCLCVEGGWEGACVLRRESPLAAQNRESRIARFLESRAGNRQKFRSEKQKIESNRSKVESRKIDSESPSESQPINAQSDLGIARFESHDSESPDSRFRIADSVPLRARQKWGERRTLIMKHPR